MDLPFCLQRRTLVVERDEPLENRGIGDILGPTISLGHSNIELRMELTQNAHKASLIDVLIGVAQRLPCPNFLKHIVEAGHRQLSMTRKHILAMRVEALSEFDNSITN